MGIVFDIQRFCVHDGPGIRTSVFLKGCMMHCPWCHNPESIKKEIQLSFENSKCVSCGKCAQVCQNKIHTFSQDKTHLVDFERCISCGNCVQSCPFGCLKLIGKEMPAKEVMDEVIKDRKYYHSSGGGVTFTGGEPTVQFDFLIELLTLAKEEGLHTCIETNGAISRERIAALAKLTDLFLLDYKATGKSHKALTGVEETVVLDTLDTLNELGCSIILRCPIIQGINDSEEHFEAIKRIHRSCYNVKEAEIMPYHSFGTHKWHSIGAECSLEALKSATPEMKAEWEKKIGE